MDTTARYILMCEKAREIQIYKFKLGIQEGDIIWNGDKVCVCGMDWICVENYFCKTGRPQMAFAILKDLKVTYTQDHLCDTVTMREGKYIIKRYGGIGMWLPRQDQLQKIANENNPMKFGESVVGNIWEGASEDMNYFQGMKTWEQFWLAIAMLWKYKKTWSVEKKEWS